MNKTLLLALYLTSLSVFGFAQDDTKENITCKQANELIQKHQNNPGFIIIDFRTEEMFREGHLRNAIVKDVFSEDIDAFLRKLDKGKTYLIYCNVGYRSKIALNKMKEMGFKNLYHLYEGIKEWKNQGFETVPGMT